MSTELVFCHQWALTNWYGTDWDSIQFVSVQVCAELEHLPAGQVYRQTWKMTNTDINPSAPPRLVGKKHYKTCYVSKSGHLSFQTKAGKTSNLANHLKDGQPDLLKGMCLKCIQSGIMSSLCWNDITRYIIFVWDSWHCWVANNLWFIRHL